MESSLNKVLDVLKQRLERADPCSIRKLVEKAAQAVCAEEVISLTWHDQRRLSLLRDVLRLDTACFRRVILICDHYTLLHVLPIATSVITRGGLVITVLDTGVPWSLFEHLNVPVLEPESRELTTELKRALDLSEVLEQPLVLRLPLYVDYVVDTVQVECIERTECYFYKHWRRKYAWTNFTECVKLLNESIKIPDKILYTLLDRGKQTLLVVDASIAIVSDDVLKQDSDIFVVKVFTSATLRKLREVVSGKRYSLVHVLSSYADSISRYLRKVTESIQCVEIPRIPREVVINRYKEDFYIEPSTRLLLSAVYKLLNLFQNLNIFVVTTISTPREVDKGKYDTRLVLELPQSLYDIGDIEFSKCSAELLKLLDDSLPLGVHILCVERDVTQLSISDLELLRSFRRVTILGVVDYDKALLIKEVLSRIGIEATLLTPGNDLVYELEKALRRRDVFVLLVRPRDVELSIAAEECDKCGDCLKSMCTALMLTEQGPAIRTEQCSRCLACVVLCTRGAIRAATPK